MQCGTCNAEWCASHCELKHIGNRAHAGTPCERTVCTRVRDTAAAQFSTSPSLGSCCTHSSHCVGNRLCCAVAASDYVSTSKWCGPDLYARGITAQQCWQLQQRSSLLFGGCAMLLLSNCRGQAGSGHSSVLSQLLGQQRRNTVMCAACVCNAAECQVREVAVRCIAHATVHRAWRYTMSGCPARCSIDWISRFLFLSPENSWRGHMRLVAACMHSGMHATRD